MRLKRVRALRARLCARTVGQTLRKRQQPGPVSSSRAHARRTRAMRSADSARCCRRLCWWWFLCGDRLAPCVAMRCVAHKAGCSLSIRCSRSPWWLSCCHVRSNRGTCARTTEVGKRGKSTHAELERNGRPESAAPLSISTRACESISA